MLDQSVRVNLSPMSYSILEVPGAYSFLDPLAVEILHQCDQTGLRDLLGHSLTLDGLDLVVCCLLLGFWQTIDVLQDVDKFGNAQSIAHLTEHVVLWFALLVI